MIIASLDVSHTYNGHTNRCLSGTTHVYIIMNYEEL